MVDGTEKLREGSKVEVRNQGDPARQGCRQSAPGSEKPQARKAVVNPSRLFILRPVATALSMVAILLAGVLAYRQLPVSALPQVDYPTIQVLTFYPGASPDVMASSVTAPLERQFGQMPGLNQMTSTSSGGSFGHHAPIQSGSQPGRRRTASAGSASMPRPPSYRAICRARRSIARSIPRMRRS